MKEIKITNTGTYDIPSETVSDRYRLVLALRLHSIEDGNYPGR